MCTASTNTCILTDGVLGRRCHKRRRLQLLPVPGVKKTCLSPSVRRTKRRVVFSATVKLHDGMRPAHRLLDLFVYGFFSQPAQHRSPLQILYSAWRRGHATELPGVYLLLVGPRVRTPSPL